MAARKTAAATPAAQQEQEPVEAVEEAPVDDRQPATAVLEAPPVPVEPEVDFSNPHELHDGHLSADLIEHDIPERELVNGDTGKKVSAADTFEREFEYGSSLLCKIRLVENLWLPGNKEPISRLVLGRGARISVLNAERIIAQLEAQSETQTETD